MAGHSNYVPKTGLARWLDQRLPVIRLMNDHFVTFPTPKNLNFWYTFGAILAVMLVVQVVTGIVLAMHYVPTADLAFGSVEQHIMREVNYGWLIRSLHASGASMLFLAVYIHMGRGLYYGSYKAPREILWILGVFIYLLLMATAFFGYTLQWGQMSYWAATVITSLFSAFDQIIPHFGTALSTWVRGDYAVGDATVNRFFALHYLLPFVIAGVVGLHIWALHVTGNGNPLGIEVKGPQDTIPFHPWYTVKDAFYLTLFLIVFLAIVFYAPNFFGNPDNYIPANPLVTPSEIRPEWYLLPFYAMLRAVPNTLLGVLVLFSALLTPLFIPWLDTSKVRSYRFRPVMKQLFWVFVATCILLGYVGAQTTDAAWHLGEVDIPLVWLARLATLYYFAFFWALMPWIGKKEVTRPVPESIAQSVLKKGAVLTKGGEQ
jgi:quinol-cytochrome oxidoreductase complex cytochrome b subunit